MRLKLRHHDVTTNMTDVGHFIGAFMINVNAYRLIPKLIRWCTRRATRSCHFLNDFDFDFAFCFITSSMLLLVNKFVWDRAKCTLSSRPLTIGWTIVFILLYECGWVFGCMCVLLECVQCQCCCNFHRFFASVASSMCAFSCHLVLFGCRSVAHCVDILGVFCGCLSVLFSLVRADSFAIQMAFVFFFFFLKMSRALMCVCLCVIYLSSFLSFSLFHSLLLPLSIYML